MSTAPRDNDVASIQYLRGIAAAMVVFAHSTEQFVQPSMRTLTVLHDVGWAGVDLFFIISGFVMTYTVAKRPYTRQEFFLRRLARIAPLYWLLTLIVAVLSVISPALFKTTQFSWSQLIASLFFFPHWDPLSGSISPLFKLGWTLNFEMFFYVVFAAFIVLPVWRRSLALALVFGGFALYASFFHPTSAPLSFYGNTLTFEFLGGCIVGGLYLQGALSKLPLVASGALLATGLALLFVFGALHGNVSDRVIWKGLPAAIIVAAMLAIECRRAFTSHFLHRLGDATYSLYLTHLFVVMGLRKVWLAAHLPTNVLGIVAFAALCVPTAIVLGIVVYENVEVRLVDGAKRLIRGWLPKPAPQPVS